MDRVKPTGKDDLNDRDLKELLSKVFGFSEFRGEQKEIIQATLQGRHSLVIMPTGMGKSLCYEMAARLLGGLTVVVSPLIALMKDQVDRGLKVGLRTTFINSSLGKAEREERYRRLANREYEILFVTPERFRKAEFLAALGENQVKLLAVDEAHCISEWGHDFRPDYTRLKDFRAHLGFPTTMALTATATPDVQEDILLQLGLKSEEVTRFSNGIRRPNLRLAVKDLYGIDSKLRALVGLRSQFSGSMIVYFSLIATLEKASEELTRLSIAHTFYHGQLNPQLRHRQQEQFFMDPGGLMLATPAFGLGIDKRDIRSVIHFEIPATLESYYQEVGRAGRDGLPAEGILLFDEDDISIQLDFLKWAHPEPEFLAAVYKALERNRDRILSEGIDFLRSQLHFYHSRDFRLETALNLLERWGAIAGSIGKKDLKVVGPLPTEIMDSQRSRLRLKRAQEKLLEMVQYAKMEKCRLQTIYRYFGLSDAECGQCDVCLS